MRAAGDKLGHYSLLKRLGHDERRETWLARDERDGAGCTLKRLPWVADANQRAGLERRAAALAAARDPAVVGIVALEEIDGTYWARTAEVRGAPLSDAVPRGGLDRETLRACAERLASGVAAAHAAGVTHRELAPDRVYLLEDGGLQIHDFGLSDSVEGDAATRADPDDTPTITLTEAGTKRNAAFMAPEQIKGLPLDTRTDVYNVGALLYWMASGIRPFYGESQADIVVAVLCDAPRPVNELKADLGEGFAALVGRCMEKDRDARFPSATELREALQGSPP